MPQVQTISTSQPADAVTMTVTSEGTVIPATVNVQSVNIWQELNRIPRAKLIILDGSPTEADFPVSAQDYFVPGKAIEIKVGYHSDEEILFKGIVTKHSIKIRKHGKYYLTVDCAHQAVKMTRTPRNKYFHDATDSDTWTEILDAYEIESEIEPTEFMFSELLQYRCTDWDYLVTRAELNGYFVNALADKVEIGPPDFDQEITQAVNFGATILSLDAEIDASTQLNGVSSRTWDYSKTEITEIEGSSMSPSTPGNLTHEELSGVFGSESLIVESVAKQPDEVLQKWANATLLRHELAKVRGRVQFQGIPNVKAGVLIELQGLGDRFNGNTLVTGVKHEVSNGNWIVDVQFGMSTETYGERYDIGAAPGSNITPAMNGLQIGVVTQIEGDPENDDRILVNLPLIDALGQGVWSRLASKGSGDTRGIIIRPEIGDEVVLGFLNDDPNNPIILGSLNSSNLPSPITPSDDNFEKGWMTKSEISLLINDDETSAKISLPSGREILLSDGDSKIEIKDGDGNSLKMDSDGITIESSKDIVLKTSTGDVKIEAKNFETESSIGTTIKANASAEVSASGTTTIKGGLVQIN